MMLWKLSLLWSSSWPQPSLGSLLEDFDVYLRVCARACVFVFKSFSPISFLAHFEVSVGACQDSWPHFFLIIYSLLRSLMSSMLCQERFWALSAFLHTLIFSLHSFLEHKFDFLPAQPGRNLTVRAPVCSCLGKVLAKPGVPTPFSLNSSPPGPSPPNASPYQKKKRLRHEVVAALKFDSSFSFMFLIAVKICFKRMEDYFPLFHFSLC